jgi:hypothetical protein
MTRLLESVPSPIFDWMAEMPFPAMQSLFDPFFPKGLQWYWKGDFVKSLPDEAIGTHIAQAAAAPSELSLMHLYPIDGAVHRVPRDATAWNTRDATFSMVIAGIDPDPNKAEALKRCGREYWAAIYPVQPGRSLREPHVRRRGPGRVQATYRGNYQRLASVKATYDPDNLFRVSQNIPPATALNQYALQDCWEGWVPSAPVGLTRGWCRRPSPPTPLAKPWVKSPDMV